MKKPSFGEIVDGIPKLCGEYFDFLDLNCSHMANLSIQLDEMLPRTKELAYQFSEEFFNDLNKKISDFSLELQNSLIAVRKRKETIDALCQISNENIRIREDGLKQNQDSDSLVVKNESDVQNTISRMRKTDKIVGRFDFTEITDLLIRLCYDRENGLINKLIGKIEQLEEAIIRYHEFQKAFYDVSEKELEELTECISSLNRQLLNVQEEKKKDEPISELEERYWRVKAKIEETATLLLAKGQITSNKNDSEVNKNMALDPLTYGTCNEPEALTLARQVVNLYIEENGNLMSIQQLSIVSAQDMLDYFKRANKMPSYDYFADSEVQMVEEVKKRLIASGKYSQYFELNDSVDLMILAEINRNPNKSVEQIEAGYQKPKNTGKSIIERLFD